MNFFRYIKNILILFLLFNSACTNTRMIVEGTKKVINKASKEEKERQCRTCRKNVPNPMRLKY